MSTMIQSPLRRSQFLLLLGVLLILSPVTAISLSPGSSFSSAPTIANGDPVYIHGIATGHPRNGLQVWLFGNNYVKITTVSTNADNSYEYELKPADTRSLAPGQYFDLDICIRPCKTFKGNPLNFIRRGGQGQVEEPFIDATIFRQNTECLYGGVEWSNPSQQVYDAFMTHKKFKENFGWCPKDELAISTRIFTKKYTTRIVKAAFEFAKSRDFKTVTVCEKPNVIRETSGMMLKIAQEMSKNEYPNIRVVDTNIDAQMMWLTKNPENYNVLVSGNMFGDIVSDGFAGLIGGLGFACSANLGEQVAVFEPTHGSAPKYAEFNPSIVNPIAMILSACMMLDHIGEASISQTIQDAVAKVIEEGKVKTYDMMKLPGTADAFSKGAATTQQMTDAIIEEL